MSAIPVVDDSALCCDLLVQALAGQGYRAVPCSASAATARIEELKPAIVILELSGQGMSVLQSLRASERHKALPVIVLTEQTSRHAVMQAAGLGVRDYILKSRFSMPELLTRIRKYIPSQQNAGKTARPIPMQGVPPATHTARCTAPPPTSSRENEDAALRREAEDRGISLLTRNETLHRLEGATIKTLPGAVVELMALVNSPRCTAMDVAQSLRRDPVLSSRVLQVANSAAFASQRARIPTVEEAVKHIGIATVRNLIMTVGVYEAFACGAAAVNMLQTWQHSLAVASLMEKLTPADDANPPGVPYVVGLCHDLCAVVLQQYFAKEYEQAIELARATGKPSRQIEAAIFGLSHNELSLAVLSKLGLPGVVTAPIQEVLERGIHKTVPGAGSPLGRTLRIANVYAHGLMLSPTLDEPVLPFSTAECRQIFGENMPSIDDQLVRAESVMTAATLACLSGRETAQAAELPVPRQPMRICYVRHHDYCSLDPLLALLKLTTETVDVATRLPPKVESLQDTDAMVVALRRLSDPTEMLDALEQLSRLSQVKSLPVLLCTGSDPRTSAQLPSQVSVSPLPISAQIWAQFQAQFAGKITRQAA